MRTDLCKCGIVAVLSGVFIAGLGVPKLARADDSDSQKAATAAAEEAMKKAEQALAEAEKKAQRAQAEAEQKLKKHADELQKRSDELTREQFWEKVQANKETGDKQLAEMRGTWVKTMGGETGKYWLGVACREVSPELRAQLGLDDGQGVFVVNVAPDSAAAKAGLKQYDVIVTVNDTKLAHVPDLSKAVNAADGKGVSLTIIRGGKEQTLTATPDEHTPAVSGGGTLRLAQPGTGILMPKKIMEMQARLPDNVSISVQRKGSEPAKITVKRGDESWEVTDKELDKLPADLRTHVERMLGNGPVTLSIGGGSGGFGGGAGAGFGGGGGQVMIWGDGQGTDGNKFFKVLVDPNSGVATAAGKPATEAAAASGDVMKRLEQLDERLQKMQEEIKRMREESRK